MYNSTELHLLIIIAPI